jgi:hypothetical protein
MAMTFYMKKSFEDPAPDIELVNIHYSWTPAGEPPNWDAYRETRMMPRGGVLLKGMGGTTLDESGEWGQSVVERVELPDDGIRRKVLRLPNGIQVDGSFHEHYAFHHYFEVFHQGQRHHSPLFSEDIVTKEIEYIDHVGNIGGMCVYWSIYDWDAPQYSPTEEQNFVAWYGEDNPFRSHKLYASENKDEFLRIRSEMVAALPMPRRFVTRIRGPRGAELQQGWHVGGMYTANRGDRWEDYWGWYTHVL